VTSEILVMRVFYVLETQHCTTTLKHTYCSHWISNSRS
jgi:hypothetical protein